MEKQHVFRELGILDGRQRHWFSTTLCPMRTRRYF